LPCHIKQSEFEAPCDTSCQVNSSKSLSEPYPISKLTKSHLPGVCNLLLNKFQSILHSWLPSTTPAI